MLWSSESTVKLNSSFPVKVLSLRICKVSVMLYVKGNSEKHIVWSVLSLDHSVRPPSQILGRTPLIRLYCQCDFVHGHYQSIRPAPIVQPQQPQSPTVTQQYRSQLPSVDSIGEPNLQSTNVNCDATCDTSNQNSTRTRNSRESSYLSTSNIIQKRTRNSKK